MFDSIKKVMGVATKATIGWMGTKLGIPKPITGAIASKVSGLFDKSGYGGGDIGLIDTSVQPQSYGGRMPFIRPRMSGASKDYAKPVNANTLKAEWDSRLGAYYTQAYKIKRTVGKNIA